MPELPEVETSCRGITPFVLQQTIQQVIIRNAQLRWPIAASLASELVGQTLHAVTRRGKYLLLHADNGTLIIHLGMSGCLRVLSYPQPAQKHDHVDIIFTNATCLRLTDPRRFGAVVWTCSDPTHHPLLAHLGVEPLERSFTGRYLFARTRTKNSTIKQALMHANIVAGIGNIYANESLFAAGIHPQRTAKDLTLAECQQLVKSIKRILRCAIQQGGTTLRDFLASDGKPGYFRQHLQVYDHGGKPCPRCQTLLLEIRLGQRTTVFCEHCQK